MLAERVDLYKQLSEKFDSPVICYVTGDRPGLETQVSPDAVDVFLHHLDIIGVVKKLTLVLYTNGGDTMAAWSLINLLRIFSDELHVIIPRKAYSAGTLISLGADKITMTKQAVLGPIDPSINTPLNPEIAGNPNARMPVSVEALNGYLEFARNTMGEGADLTSIFLQLSNQIHPLVLGGAYRSRSQIRMLATSLLEGKHDEQSLETLLSFLCSDSGSHDYSINRREAKKLALPVEKPSSEEYDVIKAVYDDFANELEFSNRYDPMKYMAGAPTKGYSFCRSLVESSTGEGHGFWSEGTLTANQVTTPHGVQNAINDQRHFEGWRKV